MVTKKRRRAQLTRASLQRQQLRRTQRERRRRRIRRITTAVLVALAVTALVVWISLHEADSGSSGQPAAHPVDYPSGAAQAARLAQTTAPTTGGAR